MGIEYKREFFDRDYTLGETYGRVWKYASRYRLRIIIGIVTGMLTASTLVPLFQVIQPALEKVSANEVEAVIGEDAAGVAQPAPQEGPQPERRGGRRMTKFERELAAKARQLDDPEPLGNSLPEQVPLGPQRRTGDERDLVPAVQQPLAGVQRVLLRAAHDHPRNHMADLHLHCMIS